MRPAGALALLLVVAALALVPGAAAHANLERAEPAPNARLPADGLPEHVRLAFTEPLDPSFTQANLLDDRQERVQAGPHVIEGTTLRLPLPPTLPDGVYTLTWRALSTVDGHVTAGAFVYVVGNATIPLDDFDAATSSTATSGGPGERLARAVAMGGLFLLGGVAVFVVALEGPVTEVPPAYAARIRRVAIAGGVVAALGALAAGVLYAARAGDASDAGTLVAALSATRVGQTWVARVALAAAATLALLAAPRAPRAAWGAATALAGLALAAQATASHAGALPQPEIAIFVDWVHLAAGAAWLGGLPALGLALAMGHRERRTVLALAFSSLASWMVAAVVLTGTVLSFGHLGTLANLWLTPWGRALVVKLALVGVLLLFGAYNRFVLVPAIERGETDVVARLRRAVSFEAGVAVALILSVAAVTAESPPSSDAEGGGPGSGGILVLEDEGRYGTDFRLRVRPAEPLTPGLKAFEVTLTNATGAIPNANVSLVFTYLDEDIGSSRAELDHRGDGVYRGLVGDLALPGSWRLEVVASGRPDALDERVSFDVVVEP